MDHDVRDNTGGAPDPPLQRPGKSEDAVPQELRIRGGLLSAEAMAPDGGGGVRASRQAR